MNSQSEQSFAPRKVWASLNESFRLKIVWLALAGLLTTVASPLVTWLTINLSVSGSGNFPFALPSLMIIINGFDATWNVSYGPFSGLRIIHVQLVSLSIAFLSLLMGIFKVVPSKYVRGSLFTVSGILGVSAPIDFAYAMYLQGQQLTQEFQQLTPFLGSLSQPNYAFAVGPGLILATLGPLLLLASGAIVFREKPKEYLSTAHALAQVARAPQPPSNHSKYVLAIG